MAFWKKVYKIAAKIDPFNGDNRGEIRTIVLLVLAVAIGAILTGATMPGAIGTMVNATAWNQAGSYAILNTSTTPAATVQTWNAVPVMYTLGVLIVPIAVVVKYLDLL